MAAPNNVRKDTAAMYFVYVKEVEYLPPLLSRVVHSCIQTGCKTLIADLVNEHRGYEDVYRSLGFEKSAEWQSMKRNFEQSVTNSAKEHRKG